jgi:hypothetical protein
VFTARYELIPYIQQITFRLLKVNIQLNCEFKYVVKMGTDETEGNKLKQK